MRLGRNRKRFYLLVAGSLLAAGAYYLTVTLPLVRKERALDERISGAISQLAAAGHGMSTEEVDRKTDRIRKDIESFAAIGGDPARLIRFSPETEQLLAIPFQLIDFDRRKFLVVDHLRTLSKEQKVKLFEGWEMNLPTYASQRPYDLWAQLTVMDQLLRTVLSAGITSVDGIELLSGSEDEGTENGQSPVEKVSVRIQLTGPMAAIHSVIMMLPLNGAELEALGIARVSEPKSSFFLSRFLLAKSSAENADEVKLDVVVSGFLDNDHRF